MWGSQVYPGSVSFSGLKRTWALFQDPRVGTGSFTTVPATAQYNPRAKGHESLPPGHFPNLLPSLLPQEGAR